MNKNMVLRLVVNSAWFSGYYISNLYRTIKIMTA